MAQYDLLLTQNVHASGIEFSEKYVNIGKGDLLSGIATTKVPTVLAAGTNTYVLVRDDAEATGLKWVAQSSIIGSGAHVQNTDTGTSSTVFELDNDGFKIELTAESAAKLGVKVDGGATYADLQAKDATFAKVTVSAAPSAGTDLTNKTYVDGLLAANDAMVFKGTVGTGGTHEIAAFNALVVYNAGWAYKVITAGTIKGVVAEIGDMFVATVDRASLGVDADWVVLQTNIDGAVVGPAASITDNAIAIFNGVTGKIIEDSAVVITGAANTITLTKGTSQIDIAPGAVLNLDTSLTVQTGAVTITGNAAGSTLVVPSGSTTLGTMAAAATSDYVAKALYDANTILYATTNDTPAALTVGASTHVGRKATGDISALTPAESMNILWQTAPATKTSTGTLGMIAKDDNFFYVCTASDVWKRSPIATNW